MNSAENSQQSLTGRSAFGAPLRNSATCMEDSATGTTRYFSTNKTVEKLLKKEENKAENKAENKEGKPVKENAEDEIYSIEEGVKTP